MRLFFAQYACRAGGKPTSASHFAAKLGFPGGMLFA
jgi:hypothetical protein